MEENIKSFFSDIADRTAKSAKFVRRKSKLTGSLFLQIFVFGFLRKPEASLNDLSAFSEDNFDIGISPQGIDERISKHSVSFLKTMFGKALDIFRLSARIPPDIIRQFSAVNITDSTGFSLPEDLAEEFPGSGGSASKAGLKLQLIFDFLTGCFRAIDMTDGITPDRRYEKHIGIAEPNSLNLFDLGYFSLAYLKDLVGKRAYFICRFLHGTGLYGEDGAKVNLPDLSESETRDRFESELRIGGKTMLECRVCFFRVKEETADLRRRNAIKKAAKKGRTPKKESLMFMNWTIFITNVPVTMLPLGHIALLYSIRWQIELIFKLWKSHMAIHKIAGFRKERILTELYAKLIGLVLFQYIAMPLRKQNIDLSPTKMFGRFTERIRKLVKALCDLKELAEEIKQICSSMSEFGKREKRKTRLSSCQKLLLELCGYS